MTLGPLGTEFINSHDYIKIAHGMEIPIGYQFVAAVSLQTSHWWTFVDAESSRTSPNKGLLGTTEHDRTYLKSPIIIKALHVT